MLFSNSGAADCETLTALFAERIEQNKDNQNFLNSVISLLKRAKCTDTDTYFLASEYRHAVNPTAESAEGCAYQAIKKEDYKKAAEYLKEAIELETNPDGKADYAFWLPVHCLPVRAMNKPAPWLCKLQNTGKTSELPMC